MSLCASTQTRNTPWVVCLAALALMACVSQPPTDSAPIADSGLYSLSSSGMQRDYYVNLPTGYASGEQAWPLIIALHGAGDSYEGWLDGGFQGDGLRQASADGAIMVIPNARLNVQQRRVWDVGNETDYVFFLDLLAELDQRVRYDRRQIFITGHSAGALMTHELGCRYGDLVRAIAPSAGSITSSISPQCTGSVAVLQLQSDVDQIVPVNVVTDTRDLWVLYNGFDPDSYIYGLAPECVDYSFGSQSYPVQWCLHSSSEHDGHAWWAGADTTIWNFFSNLAVEEPTASPPSGGGNRKLAAVLPRTISFTVSFPPDMPQVIRAGLFLYPEGSQLPVSGAPLQILNANVDLGDATAGTEQRYEISIKLPAASELPKTYTLLLAVYVEGGSMPIPTPGIDHSVIHELTVEATDASIVIPDVLLLKAI